MCSTRGQQHDFARARSAQVERNEFEERFPRLPLSAQRLYQGAISHRRAHRALYIVWLLHRSTVCYRI